MENFKAIYKILSALEQAMDYPTFDFTCIMPETLGVSKDRCARYIEMLSDAGYIKGAEISEYADGQMAVAINRIKITLKGLEYLQENKIMREMYKAARGLKTVNGL